MHNMMGSVVIIIMTYEVTVGELSQNFFTG